MLPIVQQVAQEYKKSLQDLYGNDLESVILFGSYARGDHREDSDLDFAIVLKQPEIRATSEIIRTAGIAASLWLKYGMVLSSFPTSSLKVRTSSQAIYQNIRREGIQI